MPQGTGWGLANRSVRCRVAAMTVGIWLLLSADGAAQTEAVQYPVTGRVVDNLTGQPIARVLVDAGEDATLTDGEGRFELRLAQGEAQMTLRRPGYSHREEDISHRVRVSARMAPLEFALTPAAVLRGRVTLSTGDEAGGVRIATYRRQTINGHARWMASGATETNSDGVFEFNGLEVPAAYVVCSLEVNESTSAMPGTLVYGYPSVCLPGAEDFRTSGRMMVMPGQQKDLDFALTRQRFYPVAVSLTGDQGGLGGQAEVYDRSGRPLAADLRWNASRGMAEGMLPNGNYSLELKTWGKQPGSAWVDFRVANGPVATTARILPMQPTTVTVRREFTAREEEHASEETRRRMDRFAPLIMISRWPMDRALEGQAGSGLSQVRGAPEEVYEMEPAPPGRYQVQVDAMEGYVSSITAGVTDLAREPLVVGAGGAAAPITVTLRNDWGQIGLHRSAAARAGGATGYQDRAPLRDSPVSERVAAARVVREKWCPNAVAESSAWHVSRRGAGRKSRGQPR